MRRALLIYDGIHYDPLVKEGEEGTVLQRVFHISNDAVLVQALELAKDAYEVGIHTIGGSCSDNAFYLHHCQSFPRNCVAGLS